MPRQFHQVAFVRDRRPGRATARRRALFSSSTCRNSGSSCCRRLTKPDRSYSLLSFSSVRGPTLDALYKTGCFEFGNVATRLARAQLETLAEGLHLRERLAFS